MQKGKKKKTNQKTRGESNLVQLYSPENQLVHKDTTISPSDSHRLLHQVSPTPHTASGNRECHFRNSLLCLEVGCHQLWGHWPAPRLRVTERAQEVWPPKDQRLCFLLLLNQLPAWSSLCSVMWHGSDDWGTVKRSQMPANGPSPAQEEKLLPGFENSRSYVWRTQQAMQENLLAENDFHQFLEPEAIKIKTGGKKSLNNLFPNSEEAISYFLSWKASWVTKIQVHVFGSEVAIGVASQCQPVSGLLPVRVQFPLWYCAGARASESSWIVLCTNVKDFPV